MTRRTHHHAAPALIDAHETAPQRLETCANCRAWYAEKTQCRLKSPVGFVAAQPNRVTGQPEPVAMSYWPPSQENDWCLEHVAFEPVSHVQV